MQRRVRLHAKLPWLLASCGALPACESSETDPPLITQNFCRRWVESFAEYIEACGCGADAVGRYREETPFCDSDKWAPIQAAIASGDLVYDEAAADALLSRFRGPDPVCVEEAFRDLRLDSLEAYSWAGVFKGTHAVGEPCTLPNSYKGGPSDCLEGLCAPNAGGGGTCIALVVLGESCDADGASEIKGTNPRLCFDRRLADADGEYESAFDSLACVATTPGGSEHACTRDLEDGQACEGDGVCKSGRCALAADDARVCSPKSIPGESCASSDDCLAGACRYDPEPSVCGDLLEDGVACGFDDAACASGACRRTGDTTTACVRPSSALGDACTSDADCVSDTCRAGRCWNDICGDYLGGPSD